MTPQSATLDRNEIEKFSRSAPDWWNESGDFAPLHRLNPVRLAYIRTQIVAHFGLDAQSLKPFTGLRLLDNPLHNDFARAAKDFSVNYLATALPVTV